MIRSNLGIAKIHLLSHKRQTLIAILGVTFGIAMFILMISFMKGANQFLRDAMLSSTPDIHIYNDIKTDYSVSLTDEYFKTDSNRLVIVHHQGPKRINKNIKNIDAIISDLKKDETVLAASPVLTSQVFFNYGSAQCNGVIDGVDIIEEISLFNLSKKMVSGRPDNLLLSKNGILLGQGLAHKLNVRMGDWVNVFTAAGQSFRFKVEGTFQFGLGLVDNIKAIMNIASVQQLLGKDPGYITDIYVRLKDINKAKHQAVVFGKRYGYKAEDWGTLNSSIIATNIVRNILTYVVSLALLIVAGFGIYNIMNITIVGKMKDIAILKAQGFTGKDILTIFLSQSLIIGIIGGVMGAFIGFVLSYFISRVPFPQNDSISLKYFPVLFEVKFYVLAVVFGIITTFMAGLMPSLKAAKLDPVAILRG